MFDEASTRKANTYWVFSILEDQIKVPPLYLDIDNSKKSPIFNTKNEILVPNIPKNAFLIPKNSSACTKKYLKNMDEL